MSGGTGGVKALDAAGADPPADPMVPEIHHVRARPRPPPRRSGLAGLGRLNCAVVSLRSAKPAVPLPAARRQRAAVADEMDLHVQSRDDYCSQTSNPEIRMNPTGR